MMGDHERFEVRLAWDAADLRAADPFRQGGGRAYSKADRSRFLDALDRALR